MAIKLVRLVKEHPCLYNFKLPEYSQREAIDDAWKEIGAQLNMDEKGLRDKWRNYRTVFMRRWKSSGSRGGSSSRSSYYLMDEMKFLLDYVKITVPLAGGSSITDLEKFKDKLETTYTDETTMYITEEEPSLSDNVVNQIVAPNVSVLQLSASDVAESATDVSRSVRVHSVNETNPRRLFFMSILPELDKLTDKKFRKFRKLCLNYLDESDDDY